jgi:hypothetical protein
MGFHADCDVDPDTDEIVVHSFGNGQGSRVQVTLLHSSAEEGIQHPSVVLSESDVWRLHEWLETFLNG